jgi:hypothetical protein
MRSIEIDDLSTWEPVYAPYFATLARPEEWKRWLDPEDYSSADTNAEKLARFLAPSAPKPLKQLRDQLEEFYRQNFTHAVFYHACRITDPAEYERDGLRRCDIAELKRQALALWGDTKEVRMALAGPSTRSHADSCRDKVGLWYSRDGAAHYGDHYTKGGSEFLRVVSNALGPEYRAKLEAQGRPALVRCVVPLAELHPEVVRTCSYLPLKWKLTWRNPDAPVGFYALDWAFMHEHPVSPDRISIEYLDDSG